MCKISIIVPVYNVEKYLKVCIKSILKQTYENIEIILVDDGSTDNSPQICDDFQMHDSRIKVIHKKNGGVSSARNIGIMNSTGEYICFVDSDDWLPKDAIENLYLGMTDNQVDFMAGSICAVWPRGKNFSYMNDVFFDRKDEEKLNQLLNVLYKAPWAKLYKKSIIVDNNMTFDENLSYGEDTLFLYSYLSKCNSYGTTRGLVYFYNNLLTNSASRKYYPQFNLWLSEIFKKYIEIFTNDFREKSALEISKHAIYYFLNVCDHYVLSSFDDADEKLIESYELFYQYLPRREECDDSFLNDNRVSMYFDTYLPCFKNKNFDKLKESINTRYKIKNSNIYGLLKKISSKIKFFMIFKLELQV